jgi:hypothetical protein
MHGNNYKICLNLYRQLAVHSTAPLTLMLDFKLLIINDVALWKSLLTSVLYFKSLAINDVALVVLYMRICTFADASRKT